MKTELDEKLNQFLSGGQKILKVKQLAAAAGINHTTILKYIYSPDRDITFSVADKINTAIDDISKQAAA